MKKHSDEYRGEIEGCARKNLETSLLRWIRRQHSRKMGH